jgi:hypothetical protein
MAKDPTLKKKRKSEAMLDAAPPAEGSTSAQAVVAEVDAEHAEKKAKKDKKDKKKKSGDGDVTMATEAGDVTMEESGKKKDKKEKVSLCVNSHVPPNLTRRPGRIRGPSGRHHPDRQPHGQRQTAKEAAQDREEILARPSTQAGCQGGHQGAPKGRTRAPHLGREHYPDGRDQPSAVDGRGGQGRRVCLGDEQGGIGRCFGHEAGDVDGLGLVRARPTTLQL